MATPDSTGGAALEHALAFAAAHRGRIGGYDAGALQRALDQLDAVQGAIADAEERAGDGHDDDERLAEIAALTLFFDREWGALPDARAEALMADPQLAAFRHLLRVARRTPVERPTEADELLIAETAIARAVARGLAGSQACT